MRRDSRLSRSFPFPQPELNPGVLRPRNMEGADSQRGPRRKRGQSRGFAQGGNPARYVMATYITWCTGRPTECHNLFGQPNGKTCSLLTASAHCELLIGAECGSVRDVRFRSLEFCGEAACDAVDRVWIVQRATGREQVSCQSVADWLAVSAHRLIECGMDRRVRSGCLESRRLVML